MDDGTYYKQANGRSYDYAERWAYGYIVGVGTVAVLSPAQTFDGEVEAVIEDIPAGTLYGVWRDPVEGTVCVDLVKHVDTATDALALAREHNELAIYNLRTNEVVYVEEG